MKLLSQQIRELVEQTHASSYAIAKEAGIDKSAMSRFMNGGRLTMDKLDQLAKVLGVTITSEEVSPTPRPLEKGRPSQKVRKTMDKKAAQECADYYAQDAFENYFESRRGVWYLKDVDCLLLYNNNPYQIDPSIRPKEMKRIEKRLKEVGVATLARGEGGNTVNGDSEQSYSMTLLLDCSRDRMDEVIAIAKEETSKGMAEVDAILSNRNE